MATPRFRPTLAGKPATPATATAWTIPKFETAAQDQSISDAELIEIFRHLPITGIDRWLPKEDQQAPKVLDILARHRPQMYSTFMRIGMEGL